MAAMRCWLFLFASHVGVLAEEEAGRTPHRFLDANASKTEARRLATAAGISPLQNVGYDCFGACYKQVGFCTWCGNGNACCKVHADEQNEAVPMECLGHHTYTGAAAYQCTTSSYKPGQYGPTGGMQITSISKEQCTPYMASTGCGWTREESCPSQARGSKGIAANDGSIGYRCCCGLGYWKDMNVRPKLTRQDRLTCKSFMEDKSGGCGWTQKYTCPGQVVSGSLGPAQYDTSIGYKCCCTFGLWNGGDWTLAAQRSSEGYNSEEFGLKVGNNGFGGQTSTSGQPQQVISGQSGNGNGFSVSIGSGVQTNVRGHDDGLEQDRKNERTFLDNHAGGNAMRQTIHYNPSATYRSANIGPIENSLSNANGPCVFGICTDLDPNHAPGVKSYRSKLMYPNVVGVNRITVKDGYKYKDMGIKKLQVADDGPLEEECLIKSFDTPNDILCEKPLQYQHVAGDSVFGRIKNATSMLAKRFIKYALVGKGQNGVGTSGHYCDTPIKTIEECSEAAARLELTDTHAQRDYQAGSTSDPPWCYFESGKLKFNNDGSNIGRCTEFDQCLCSVVGGTGVAATTQYWWTKTGTCQSAGYLPITTKLECSKAAVGLEYHLGLAGNAAKAIEDYQSSASTDPPYCYYEASENILKFNSNGGNTGSCTADEWCFCIKPKPFQVVGQAISTTLLPTQTLSIAPVVGAAAPVMMNAPPTLAATPAPTLPPTPPPTQAIAAAAVVSTSPSIRHRIAGPTVVPVTSTLAQQAKMGESQIEVADQSLFKVGDYIRIGGNETKEIIGLSSLVLDSPLGATYPANAEVVTTAAPPGGTTVQKNGVSGSLVGGSSANADKTTWLMIGCGLCVLGCCCISLGICLTQCGGKRSKKRSGTDRERELKDMMMSEAELDPIMSSPPETDLAGPPAAPMFSSMDLKGIPEGTIYNVAGPQANLQMPSIYQPQSQLGMTTSLTNMGGFQPGGSMYTGSMYSPYR